MRLAQEIPDNPAYILEIIDPRQTHGALPSLPQTCGDIIATLPVACPRDADLVPSRDIHGKLAGVVVFSEVCDSRGGIHGYKVRAVEGAGEVLGYAAAEGGPGLIPR